MLKARRDSYLLHSFDNHLPTAEELVVGKLAVVFFNQQSPILYTKDYLGNVLEIGKGASKLADLEDVDISNAKEGSFFTRQGTKFRATRFIGSISNLNDVEISNPLAGQYLRYNDITESFSNYYPSYYLHELSDVEVANPLDELAAQAQANQVLYYDHSSGKYKTRPRTNLINELADVAISAGITDSQLLAYDASAGLWRNTNLQIVNDDSPELGNNLDAKGFEIRNSSYRLNSLVCNQPIVELNYKDGDYWVLTGVPIAELSQCIVNINIQPRVDSTIVLLLEIRQDTGAILLGNLPNVKYEDGKPLKLSGAGKTDLVTITMTSVAQPNGSPPLLTTYVSTSALNLATLGQGGVSSYRYDKSRYPFVQNFEVPKRYDDYFDYVESLLTFEPEVSTGKDWLSDKACRVSALGIVLPTTVTTSGTNISSNKFNLGIEDYVLQLAKGLSTEVISSNGVLGVNQYVQVTPSADIVLDADFTLELYLNYKDIEYRESDTAIGVMHRLFSSQTSSSTNRLELTYKPLYTATGQQTELSLTIGNSSNSVVLLNAYTYFHNKTEDFYTHLAIQRRGAVFELYIDGVLQNTTGLSASTATLSISSYICSLYGRLSTLRITNKVARYLPNLINTPALRFGLVGGANEILDRQVFNSFTWLDRDLEHEIFC